MGKHRFLFIMAVLAGALVLVGCSGDDNPSAPGTGLDGLEGTYLSTAIYAQPWTGFARITMDGEGTFSYQQIQTSDDVLENGSFSYTMQSNGRFNLGGDAFYGQFNAANGLFAGLDLTNSDAGVLLGVDRGSNLGNSSLAGTYRGVGVEYWNSGSGWESTSLVMRLVANGTGSATFTAEYQSSGSDSPTTLSYQVQSDGQVLWVGQPDARGAISPDGGILLLNVLGAESRSMYLLVKEGTGMSNADLSGSYTYMRWPSVNNAEEFGTFTANGSGGIAVSLILPESASGTATYSVSSEGKLRIPDPDDEIRGALSPDGRLGVLVELDDTPDLTLFIKQN